MLKRKLKCQLESAEQCKNLDEIALLSANKHFVEPLWQTFYNLECILNEQLRELQIPSPITHTYNPVEYAAELHCAYLKSYLDGCKDLLFVGMNPGPNGMGQTGVPFGNILTVRDVMQISGEVLKPPVVHPKRPVDGLKCTIEEPSGVRLWNLFKKVAGDSIYTFTRNCFVHNFCPLVFFDKNGKNITPNELKGEYKNQIRNECLKTLDKQIELLKPKVVVAVGDYVFRTLKHSLHIKRVRMLRLAHPSPRALNNQDWPEKAEKYLIDNDLIKYIRNEI